VFADDRFLLRRASAEEITYDDEACRDPYPRGKWAAVWRPQTVHGLDNREAGCHRPLSLILVRARPSRSRPTRRPPMNLARCPSKRAISPATAFW